MARTVNIGAQSFEDMRRHGDFLVDKTGFLIDWWNARDQITLICRPRRFGKTLTLDMVRCFLSLDFSGRGEELFGGLNVWKDERMRDLQGTVPVVSLSFANCKADTLDESLASMKQTIRIAVRDHDYLRDSNKINNDDRALLGRVSDSMDNVTATGCIGQLCSMLLKHWGTMPVVLLDEYDTPMQEAWRADFWEEMSSFIRRLFNATFKTNPALGRGLVTGITRVASESIFSDMNNPAVVTTTSTKYATYFGFTEEEVARALEEFGLCDRMKDVRNWYDGFTFGREKGIYNPWSITSFLDEGVLDAYWTNSSSNALVSDLVRTGGPRLKEDFETLLNGGTITKKVDERVHFRRLYTSPDALWSLLLSTGYLRVVQQLPSASTRRKLILAITNQEVASAFDALVSDWFAESGESYGEFCRALLNRDPEAMNHYLGEVTRACVLSFDAGVRVSETGEPERFYHGLVLGMLVELRDRYSVESNRESGLGRYDVALVPLDGPNGVDPAFIIEFKVFSSRNGENTLGDTVARALDQIARKDYARGLVERGIDPKRIVCCGIGFRGKDVLVELREGGGVCAGRP